MDHSSPSPASNEAQLQQIFTTNHWHLNTGHTISNHWSRSGGGRERSAWLGGMQTDFTTRVGMYITLQSADIEPQRGVPWAPDSIRVGCLNKPWLTGAGIHVAEPVRHVDQMENEMRYVRTTWYTDAL